jgi:hypothetical protein
MLEILGFYRCRSGQRETTGQNYGDETQRRGDFSFAGEKSKILFGMLDKADAEYCGVCAPCKDG